MFDFFIVSLLLDLIIVIIFKNNAIFNKSIQQIKVYSSSNQKIVYYSCFFKATLRMFLHKGGVVNQIHP